MSEKAVSSHEAGRHFILNFTVNIVSFPKFLLRFSLYDLRKSNKGADAKCFKLLILLLSLFTTSISTDFLYCLSVFFMGNCETATTNNKNTTDTECSV